MRDSGRSRVDILRRNKLMLEMTNVAPRAGSSLRSSRREGARRHELLRAPKPTNVMPYRESAKLTNVMLSGESATRRRVATDEVFRSPRRTLEKMPVSAGDRSLFAYAHTRLKPRATTLKATLDEVQRDESYMHRKTDVARWTGPIFKVSQAVPVEPGGTVPGGGGSGRKEEDRVFRRVDIFEDPHAPGASFRELDVSLIVSDTMRRRRRTPRDHRSPSLSTGASTKKYVENMGSPSLPDIGGVLGVCTRRAGTSRRVLERHELWQRSLQSSGSVSVRSRGSHTPGFLRDRTLRHKPRATLSPSSKGARSCNTTPLLSASMRSRIADVKTIEAPKDPSSSAKRRDRSRRSRGVSVRTHEDGYKRREQEIRVKRIERLGAWQNQNAIPVLRPLSR